jgi:aminoglycoside phosphotransferase (APT) family kinase protein
MAKTWDADVEVTADLARELIEGQFPQFRDSSIEVLGVGFDNVAFLVSDAVFRIPRRKMGAELIEREVRCLPLLSGSLPLPVPMPEWIGRPAGGFPYPFAGYRHLPGVTACAVDLSNQDREANAPALGRFLAALHSIPVSEEVRDWAPPDDIRRADLAKRLPMALACLQRISHLVPSAGIRSLGEKFERLAQAEPFVGPTVWVHGDLYGRHLLFDESKGLRGVIDWGDVHLGDPALDLSIAFSFLPASARGTFWSAYLSVDEATLDRARFRGLYYGLLLLEYGTDVSDGAIAELGLDALRFGMEP